MMIQSPKDIERLTLKYGFLPFFNGVLEGFSIEELTPDELWFSDVTDGPWEWKGPVIAMGSVAYGKFFRNKAGFVSLEWLPDLINYRRAQFNWLWHPKAKQIYDTILEHESLISTELKALCGYGPVRKPKLSPLEVAYEKSQRRCAHSSLRSSTQRSAGESTATNNRTKSSFDTLITRLQMALYVITADFEYSYNKQGDRYGWGKARYTTPELMYGDNLRLPTCAPNDSFCKIIAHLQSVFPEIPTADLVKFIK
jgi:hypothetical protein